MANDLAMRGVEEKNRDTASKSIAALKKEIAKEQANLKAWEETTARFREAIGKLPDSLSGLAEMSTGVSELLGAVETLDPASLEGINPADAKKIIGGIQGATTQLKDQIQMDLVDAPGISVLILELGLDLAEANKRRAATKLASLKERQAVFDEALVYTDIAASLTNFSEENIVITDELATLRKEIIQWRAQLAKKEIAVTTAADSAALGLIVLRAYVSSEWLLRYQETIMPVRLARIAHGESITVSQVNDLAWQAIVKSGIDALSEYHKGGLKEEDVANFMRLAQSIALFIIAA
jgi:uncharacterized small protein (DUF1192 family)